MTTQYSMLSVAVALSLMVGCSDPVAPVPESEGQRLYACNGTGPQPPQKVIVPASGGIEGSWNVMLVESEDLEATSAELAFRHGGRVMMLFRSINAFNLEIEDARVPELAAEASVCYAEQDMAATGT